MAQFSLKMDANTELWNAKAGRLKGKNGFAYDVNKQIEIGAANRMREVISKAFDEGIIAKDPFFRISWNPPK